MRARGIMAYEGMKVLPGIKGHIDFIVAVALADGKQTPNFTDHIQAAYDAGVPLIAYVVQDPDWYSDIGFGASMPPVERDPHGLIMSAQFKSGSVMRIIAGVLLDIRKRDLPGGKVVTPPWVAKVTRHMQSMINKSFGLMWWLYANNDILDGDDESIAGLYNPEPGASAYKLCNVKQPTSYGEHYMPAENENPNAVTPLIAQGSHFYFWRYGSGKIPDVVNMAGAEVPIPFMCYYGDVARLYSDLGYTSSIPVTPPDPGIPDDPEIPDMDIPGGTAAQVKWLCEQWVKHFKV
jgi:hypothetical protein